MFNFTFHASPLPRLTHAANLVPHLHPLPSNSYENTLHVPLGICPSSPADQHSFYMSCNGRGSSNWFRTSSCGLMVAVVIWSVIRHIHTYIYIRAQVVCSLLSWWESQLISTNHIVTSYNMYNNVSTHIEIFI